MTKTLRKAIMKRSKLKNKFNKERNAKNWSNYKQQRNYCSSLSKKSILIVKDISKRFGLQQNLFCTDKTKNINNIILTENYQTIKEDEKIFKIFDTYFTNVTKGLKLRQVDKTQSFKNEESCRLIKEHFGNGSFSFRPVSKNNIISAIKKLPSNKASISNGIPVLVMKQFAICYCEKLTNIFNDSLKENRFPNLMRVAEISPGFKRLDNTFKYNYRPVSTLSNFDKLFESIDYSQLNDYMENKFSKYLTGFRKNHNIPNFLLRMIESWKAKLNNGSKVGVIIMDLIMELIVLIMIYY